MKLKSNVSVDEASSSMEEVPAKRAEEVRPPATTTEPHEAHSSPPLASPPQSALRADSSSIEEEQGLNSALSRGFSLARHAGRF